MTTAEEAPELPVEAPDGASRVAGGCVLAIGLGVAGGVAYAVPETAYYVAGLLTAAGVRKARTWATRRRDVAEEEPEPVDIVAVLQQLGEGGQHVLLTRLTADADLPNTKAARALLDEAGVRVRAVRALDAEGVERNGPGIHRDDIPTPLPSSGAPSEACVCAGHAANTNTNNDAGEGPGEGLRVDRIGHAGTVVHTPAEAARHHAITR
ncbi:hypothetical protein GTY86_35650 [Streptomyces sp. SID5770]|uniref:hypothetical protein n=1 Tax=Streptomyces sp. SID5770 TaxID=2690308 RepID=UPI0013704198|nr:hypothetical protein [Streptomyces sp. SID5770]MZE53800.1 hypothetical protein [Streptomyces sp. SID5770]MZE56511.1 hypothetical protein [Streptomyces sp. SID5770]